MNRKDVLFLLAMLAAVFLSTSVLAQVPEVQGRCVEYCGGGSNSAARDRQLARNHAKHAKEVRWFNEVDSRWRSARGKGVKFTRKGIKEQNKGNCSAALADFQNELAAFSIDLTPRGELIDAGLRGKYMAMQYRQQNDVTLARGRVSGAQSCVAQQNVAANRPAPVNAAFPADNRVHVSAAAPAPPANAPPPRNFEVLPLTAGVNSCYRADPAKVGCFELRNNSERRVRLYVDGLPGVQCTVEPHSFCSLPVAMGNLHLRMVSDDEHGYGPIVPSDVNVGNDGTRLTLGPRQ